VRVTPQEVFQFIKANNIGIVDLKFIDLPGLWQHFSVPISELSEDSYVNGFGFDGSSIRGFQKIQESDMLLIPDASTAIKDPVTSIPTLSMICDVVDPLTRQP
jgi:glutamine synthetase